MNARSTLGPVLAAVLAIGVGAVVAPRTAEAGHRVYVRAGDHAHRHHWHTHGAHHGDAVVLERGPSIRHPFRRHEAVVLPTAPVAYPPAVVVEPRTEYIVP
jgi:hypothetical protein